MLVAAALVPDTVLLLPGVAGRAHEEPALVTLRSAAAAVVAEVRDHGPRVVVVAPGRTTRSIGGPVHVGATAAGVPDHLLAVPADRVVLRPAPGAPAVAAGEPGTGLVVGVHLALAAGVAPERLHAVEVAPGPVGRLRDTGADVCGHGPVVLVVVGSGAARHGDGAPLPADPRADAHDRALLTAVAQGGRAARDALAAADPGLVAALGVTGWAPWQVLVGAVDATVDATSDATGPTAPGPARVEHATVWRGAGHAAVVWQVTA